MKYLKLFEEWANTDYTDQWGKRIVWEMDDFKIAISDDKNPSRISLWKGDKNVGNLYLGERYKFEGEYFYKVSSIDIDKKWRGQGLSTQMYRIALEYITVAGIISYLPDRINKKQVPNVYKRLGGEVIGDFAIVRKPVL